MRILIGLIIVTLFAVLSNVLGLLWATIVFITVPSLYAIFNGYENLEYEVLSLLRTYED